MRTLFRPRVLLQILALGTLTVVIVVSTGAIALASILVWRDFRHEPWKLATEIYSVTTEGEEPIARVYGAEWRAGKPIELSALPDHVPAAFLAAEDVRFRSHLGVDLIGIARAAIMNIRAGAISQGGSTISQQVVKARYLSNARTWTRKILEAWLAIALEQELTKDQILEAYLNDVYLGHYGGRAIRGLDEAAHVYMNRKAADLTVAEAALLGAIVRAPNRDTPERRPDVAKRRRDAVLRAMHEREWIDEAQMERALEQPVRFRRGGFPAGELASAVAAVRRSVEEELGRRRTERGGLRIWTTIDPAMQRAAEKAVSQSRADLIRRRSWLRRTTREKPLQIAVLAMSPSDGAIRAIIGGASPRDPFDRTSEMRRQPGSAFKPFVYLAGIARREVSPATILLDEPLAVELDTGEIWKPANYDSRFRGKVTVREALEKSLNIPAIRLMEDIGTRDVVRTAGRVGFDGDFPPVPALPLGVVEVTMRELTAAYTIFPGLGMRAEPYLLSRVENSNGRVLYRYRTREPRRVVEPAAAYVTHSMLRGVVKRGTARRLKQFGLGYAAGKTGTTNDYRDAWFVGYTRDVVASVWVGFDDGTPLRLSSSEAALPVWGRMMRSLDLDERELPEPEGITWRKIDPVSGLLWREGCPGPFTEVFVEGTQPRRSCPRNWAGRLLEKILDENYDEPAAVTLEEVRELGRDLDRARRDIEGALENVRGFLRRVFGD